MTVTILLLAGGSAQRMRGRDKLLEQIDGTPLLRRQAVRALATGSEVLAILPEAAPDRRTALAGLELTVLESAETRHGMGASIAAGVRALQQTEAAVMILPADMPDLETKDLCLLIKTFSEAPEHPLRATTENGAPGHPVIFPAAAQPALARLSGDRGARLLLGAARQIALPGLHARTDLDTPEDWAAWRRKNPASND